MVFQKFNHPLLKELKSKKFVLASTSPRRLEILGQMGIEDVIVHPSSFPEDLKKEDYTPSEYVRATAIGKAEAVYRELESKNEVRDTVILAADTVVEIDGKIFEKPPNKEIQLQNLKYYRDCKKIQHVLTGVIIMYNGMVASSVESTSLYFDDTVSDDFLEAYVATEEGSDVAAGYRIQLRGALLVKRMDGDYYNVVGLPLRTTFKMLESMVLEGKLPQS